MSENELDEMYETLQRGGQVDFSIGYKYARAFYKQTKRINRSEIYFLKRDDLFGQLRWSLYMMYVGAIHFLLTALHKELEKPLIIYMTSWRVILKIDGKVMKNGIAVVTFYGKERKRNGAGPN